MNGNKRESLLLGILQAQCVTVTLCCITCWRNAQPDLVTRARPSKTEEEKTIIIVGPINRLYAVYLYTSIRILYTGTCGLCTSYTYVGKREYTAYTDCGGVGHYGNIILLLRFTFSFSPPPPPALLQPIYLVRTIVGAIHTRQHVRLIRRLIAAAAVVSSLG